MAKVAAISTTGSMSRHRSEGKTGLSFPLSAKSTPRKELIQQIKGGLQFDFLEILSDRTGLPLSEIAARVGIPPRTLARRKSVGRLSMEESERVFRLTNLYEMATKLYGGDVAGACRWMSLPKKALGGESPLDYAATELGAREVENLIGRLEHGVFS